MMMSRVEIAIYQDLLSQYCSHLNNKIQSQSLVVRTVNSNIPHSEPLSSNVRFFLIFFPFLVASPAESSISGRTSTVRPVGIWPASAKNHNA